jgi:hypothetical protein
MVDSASVRVVVAVEVMDDPVAGDEEEAGRK